MKKIYYYRYTTEPELVKEFGGNFFVREYEIEEEDEDYVYVKDYDYVRKEDIDDIDAVCNESFHDEINYTWFSYHIGKDTMNKFKDEVRNRLLSQFRKLRKAADEILDLVLDIK